jgi:hypothetical protein
MAAQSAAFDETYAFADAEIGIARKREEIQ